MAGQDMRGSWMPARGRLFGPAAAALGLILALAPVTVSVDLSGMSLHQPTVLAQAGTPGEDKGGDRGGDRGGNGQGNGANANANDARLKGQAAKDAARNRVNLLHGNADGNGNIGNGQFVLTDGQTQVLLRQGWTPRPLVDYDDGFANHGERISTMVQLAKELGYNPSVGALQANFLPADWYELQAAWLVATGDAKDDLEGEITELLVKLPGEGPLDEEWATINLDVDGDGVITEADLAAAQEPIFALEDETFDDEEFFWPEL